MAEPKKGRVLIVGGGIAGLSIAWALLRQGFAVEIFDQEQIPNPRGASYDEHRITRHAYGEARGYARLMPQAFAAFAALFHDIGALPLEPTPLLGLMREEDPWFESSLAGMDELDIAYERLDVEMVATRYPTIETDGLTKAFEAQGAGILYPTRILIALAVHVASRGATLRPGCHVSEVDLENGFVIADGERISGDQVVVAVGAWADRLLPSLASQAVPSRQAMLYCAPPANLRIAWGRAPIVLDMGRKVQSYVLPPRPGTRLKLGDHAFTKEGDPDDDRRATADDLERLHAAARRTIRAFDRYRVLDSKACFYTVTSDERFLVKSMEAKGYVVSACSGHGFKLAPLIAQGLADVIAGSKPAAWLADWAAGRSSSPASFTQAAPV